MELSKDMVRLLQEAVHYAQEKHYEYVTPEILLLLVCENEEFREAFMECGGDCRKLQKDLERYLAENMEEVTGVTPEFSAGSCTAIAYAQHSAENSGNDEMEIRHLLHGIWKLQECFAVYFMLEQGIDEVDLMRAIYNCREETAFFGDEEDADDEKGGDFSEEDGEEYEERDEDDDAGMKGDGLIIWPRKKKLPEEGESGQSGRRKKDGRSEKKKWMAYAPCINDMLEDVNPLIGRETELERTIQILCRKDKNNPLHIGEPGVGKTAITYGLARRINEGKVPEPLLESRIFALDLGGMLAGTQYRGDFEKRFKKVLSEIEKEKAPIIYIDEIHNLSGAGAVGEGSFDASNMLKPYLSAGRIRFIGATTFEEYKRYFEKNKSLARRFQNIEIKEPDEAEAAKILLGLMPKYEAFHGVKYEEGIAEYAVMMSAKHINERFLPDKAIDLLDEAGAYRKLHLLPGGDQIVGKDVINEVLTKICRVPLETVQTEEVQGLATLEERLKNEVFGQNEAISQVVNAIKFSKAGLLEEDKPLASLLFVGPTGVGKTEIARCLAKELGVKLIRFDMSEYGEKHAVAKLIGSPAGYVGYEEGGLMTEAIRKTPFSVLLLDEIEKAHADIYNVLLQVMDYATLTDNQGRKADFRNVVVIMTSNAGANRIGKKGIGFQSVNMDEGVVMEEVKRTFQPEFRNRLNRIVVFHGMDETMAENIIGKKLGELREMLEKKGIRLQVDASAVELLKRKGVSTEFGAREIDRVIRNEIKPLLVDDILFGSLKTGGEITLSGMDEEFSVL